MNTEFSGNSYISSTVKIFLGILEVGRIFDGVVIGLAVILGMIVSTNEIPSSLETSIAGFFLGVFLLMSMNTYNDYKDVEIDKISKPHRPIPRGAVPINVALWVSIIEVIISIFLAIYLNFLVLIIVFFVTLLAIAYSKWLKQYFLTKNIVVAFNLTLAIVAGIVAMEATITIEIVLMLLLAFVMAYSFEIHKDIGDISGDTLHEIHTIPTRLGLKKTLIIVFSGYSLGWGIAWIFLLVRPFEVFYASILIMAAIAGIIMIILLAKDQKKYIESSRITVTVFFGLAIICLMNLFI